MKTKVCLFDDSVQIRESFTLMMETSDKIELAGSFANCNNVINNITLCSADVVIMDIEIPPQSGIEAVKQIRTQFADLPIIMFTVFEDNDLIFESICAGANGYLLKKTDPQSIIQSIEEVKMGGAPMSPGIARKVVEKFKSISSPMPHPQYELTIRETEILKLLTQGLSYKMIAAKCTISFETVRTHIKNIYAKLHVASMTEAVAKALNERLV